MSANGKTTSPLSLLRPLLADQAVTEIMVNGPHAIYVEREGRLEKTALQFKDDAEVTALIQTIIKPLGRTISGDHPSVDARLPDGSRVNAIIPPVAIDGPSLTIRKFPNLRMGVEQLVQLDTLSDNMAYFLEACVKARLNLIISGGIGSGKTTLLNALSGYIPESERLVTIEDSAELQLHTSHVVRLEARPADVGRDNEITIRSLLRNALRMRPDRIIVGEVRGAEALDMLQAMNTGMPGSMTTLHANSPREVITRLESLITLTGLNLPPITIRQQIASAIDVIVQMGRLTDGRRKVVSISEVTGMEGDIVTMGDLFLFEQTGFTPDGAIEGELRGTGVPPMLMPRLVAAGQQLPQGTFARRAY